MLCQSLSIPCSLSQNYTETDVPIPSKRDVQHQAFMVSKQLPDRDRPLNGFSAGAASPHVLRSVRPQPQPKPPRQSPLVTAPVVVSELVALYFRFVHNTAHTLFHEASFIRRLNEGRAPMLHIHAMCALAAR